MDKCIGHIALTKDEAIENFLAHCKFEPKTEKVILTQALNRVAACDFCSLQTLPSLKSAQKDGIAVYYKYFADGKMPDTSDWVEGREYVHCYCGIGFKGDYDTSIMIEYVNFDQNGHLVLDPVKVEKNYLLVEPGSLVKKR